MYELIILTFLKQKNNQSSLIMKINQKLNDPVSIFSNNMFTEWVLLVPSMCLDLYQLARHDRIFHLNDSQQQN